MFAVVASIGICFAETSLIIQPISGQEQVNALAQIRYVKVTHNSLFVFSHSDFMLLKIAIKDVRHIRHCWSNTATDIDNTYAATTCRVYPNPTQDMLIIDNTNCEQAYIFDLIGRLLQTAPINGEHTSINVTSLPQVTTCYC